MLTEEEMPAACCKLVDFGNACWTHKHFTDDIQTRQYRSPEVRCLPACLPACLHSLHSLLALWRPVDCLLHSLNALASTRLAAGLASQCTTKSDAV